MCELCDVHLCKKPCFKLHHAGMESKLDEEEEAAAEREEKERGKVEEVWKLVDVESGKEALAVQSQM